MYAMLLPDMPKYKPHATIQDRVVDLVTTCLWSIMSIRYKEVVIS